MSSPPAPPLQDQSGLVWDDLFNKLVQKKNTPPPLQKKQMILIQDIRAMSDSGCN